MKTEKEKTCCFTGHRDILPENKSALTAQVNAAIEAAIARGYTHFISGGAVGFDMLAAFCVVYYRGICEKEGRKLTLEIAVPYPGQGGRYDGDMKFFYEKILKLADTVTYVSDKYSNFCMHKRNRYMVDSSALVIAFFEGRAGGTKNTVDYAARKGAEILVVPTAAAECLRAPYKG